MKGATQGSEVQRPLPVADSISEPFWVALQNRELKLQKCEGCGKYQFPPAAFCLSCSSTSLVYTKVSGRGRVYSYTETQSGVRHPAFAEITPYMVGWVELVEQANLLMLTNFPGSNLEDISVGDDVELVFDRLTEEYVLPQFRLLETDSPGAGNQL